MHKRVARKRKIKPAIKPQPYEGHKFLKSVRVGSYVTTTHGLVGKVLSKNVGSILCKFVKTPYKDSKESKYYLGDRRISPLTNVKQIRRHNA